ncbi:hypothetical protein Fcan01_26279 [Folsomia candida]|uniref:Uncharacterized protein n=1 Tax=Folsomia candida TaxID=158441 RepID=A0A226D282_FOLCA|nr:hypothetical protein Fcan01_26279 [Folsomia candida]
MLARTARPPTTFIHIHYTPRRNWSTNQPPTHHYQQQQQSTKKKKERSKKFQASLIRRPARLFIFFQENKHSRPLFAVHGDWTQSKSFPCPTLDYFRFQSHATPDAGHTRGLGFLVVVATFSTPADPPAAAAGCDVEVRLTPKKCLERNSVFGGLVFGSFVVMLNPINQLSPTHSILQADEFSVFLTHRVNSTLRSGRCPAEYLVIFADD